MRARAVGAFTAFAALFLLLLFPLDFLYRVPGRLLYLTAGEAAIDGALFILLYAAFAACLALLAALPAAALERSSPRWADRWQAVVLLLVLGLVGWQLLPLAVAWWTATKASLGIDGRGYTRYVVLAVVLLVAWRLRKGRLSGNMRTLSSKLQGARGLVLGLIALAAVGVIAGGAWKHRGFGWQDGKPPAGAAQERPNVILILIDTLTARDMSLYGYPLETTPELARFAERAFVFDHAFAASNYTTASVTSLLTGRDVSSHRVYHLDGHLAPADRHRALARALRDGGYTTAAVISNAMAHPLHMRAHDGFDYLSEPLEFMPASFWLPVMQLIGAKPLPLIRDTWWQRWVLSHAVRSSDPAVQTQSPYPPQQVARRALQVLEQAGPQPLFLWAHFLPPHAPYLSPPPYRGKFLETGEFDTWAQQQVSPASMTRYPSSAQDEVDRLRLRYDEDIAWIDHEVGSFLQTLEQGGHLDDAVVIIVSDHGESFERGFRTHRGPLLHDALVHVPLIVRMPGQATGARIPTWTSHVDLMPTILDLAGLPPAPGVQGRSLAPALAGETLSETPQLMMNLEASSRFAPVPGKGSVAVALRPHKLVRYLESSCEELFDLEQDPGEVRSLASAAPDVADRLRAVLGERTGIPLVAPADRAAACKPLETVKGELN